MLYLLWCAGVPQFCNALLLWCAVVLLWCAGVPWFCNALPIVVYRCAAVL